jgi:hypothetical protein
MLISDIFRQVLDRLTNDLQPTHYGVLELLVLKKCFAPHARRIALDELDAS